jgi:glycosyltransferase involved in cell wall biosynthesis
MNEAPNHDALRGERLGRLGHPAVINVTHVITSLGLGGAEAMLLKLLHHTDRTRFTHHVCSLVAPSESIASQLEALRIPFVSLGMKRRSLPDPWALLRLTRLLGKVRPDLLQTWMYHADLLGGMAAKLARRGLPIVWNIRQSNLDPALNRRRTLRVVRLCARVSSWLPDTIVCCSSEANRTHAAVGYDESKLRVIPNGFDLSAFQPDPDARAAVRVELGISDDTPLIGMVARFDPQKDHRNFVDAAARLRAVRPDVRFVLCGPNTSANATLSEWIDGAGVRPACHVLGPRHDIPRLTAAFDIATLSSVGEGFPNVLGEAMACGIPCVATDVGDSAEVIGDTGYVVPPRDAGALAQAWAELLAAGRPAREALGLRARQRIEERFSIHSVTRLYEQTYQTIVARRAAEDQ